MQPETRRDEPLVALPASDEDQTAWLITFSDLVLQLFAFVLVSSVLGAAHHVAVTSRAAAPPQPAVALESVAGEPRVSGQASSAPAEEATRMVREPEVAEPPAEDELGWKAEPAREAAPLAASEPQPLANRPPAEPPAVASVVPAATEPVAAAVPAAAATPASAGVPSPVLARRLASIGSYLQAFVRAQGKTDGVRITVGESDLVLSLRDTIGFPSGSAELLPAARPILAELRSIVSELPDFGIDVTGHTDDVPIHTARYPSNLDLSLARAACVAHELSAGTPSLRVRTSAEGFGENRPVASNADPQGRAQNRRVEIRLVKLG